MNDFLKDLNLNLDIGERALHGDAEATRLYCGSYLLVRQKEGKDSAKFWRCKGDIPSGYIEVKKINGESVYDSEGFLLPQYWSKSRI